MSTPYTRAPHQGSSGSVQAVAPNAALLIDFDNVTMGMRSDLSKDLQKLLQSDIIKGKVTVQRAYADWRRYPQYIVPLSENSIDLIFAPAYGSSKKNATDIRMAIDGMELVFTRPEIGTYILLTGDSDFSSLVIKLKEYGKYVIGVGIQESSSDILVQNCDEYYSYTSITGLQKTDEAGQKPADPWVLVEQAVKKMKQRDDVMRSDRLKQVMMEIDPSFDEGNFGYSKFSRFLTEAASKGQVRIRKLDNGQYEVSPGGGPPPDRGRRSDRGDRSGKGKRQGQGRDREERSSRKAEEPGRSRDTGDPLREAYGLLRRSVERLLGDGKDAVRDSDVKRKMLELDRSFDEAELGFSKFSRFLRQAHDHEIIDLHKRDTGNYEVALPTAAAGPGKGKPDVASEERADRSASTPEGGASAKTEAVPTGSRDGGSGPRETAADSGQRETAAARRLNPRRGSTRRRGGGGPPPLLEGQAVAPPDRSSNGRDGGDTGRVLDPATLGLPTDGEAAVRYLSNSYKGVGVKTAEALVEVFGEDLFTVLQSDPGRVQDVVPAGRAEAVLDAWREDFERRRDAASGGSGSQGGEAGRGGRRTRRGNRRS